jgi:hypothetical protein
MPLLVKLGVLELLCGVLTGWLMVYAADPGRLRRSAIVDARRIRQGHLDLLMMGTILVALGAAVPDPPLLPAALVVLGSWLAPLLFFPLAVWPRAGERGLLPWLDRAGFVALSAGWLALAVEVVGR